MQRLFYHGGHCCGIRHIDNLGNGPDQTTCGAVRDYSHSSFQNQEAFELAVPFNEENTPPHIGQVVDHILENMVANGRLVEITLTDDQCENGWPEWLVERGFQMVNRFRNDNSGNVVNVFHLVKGTREFAPPGDAPFAVTLARVAQPVPTAREVLTTYHNVYQRTGVGPGYETLEACERNGRNARSRIRRTTMSDGTTRQATS